MRFGMKSYVKSGEELTSVRTGQFLRGVAEHSAERGICFQNPAIELVNTHSDGGCFKHRGCNRAPLEIWLRRS